jgi:hypothetical protein
MDASAVIKASTISPSPPTQAQLALALAIVKLKPTHIDIKGDITQKTFGYLRLIIVVDHILHIRQHLKGGRKLHLEAAPRKYFESVAFWQQAYEQSEAAQSKLLDRIYDLEQRNETLQAKLKPATAVERASGLVNQKTKRSKDVTSTAKKRLKTTNETSREPDVGNIPGAPFTVPGAFECAGEGESYFF